MLDRYAAPVIFSHEIGSKASEFVKLSTFVFNLSSAVARGDQYLEAQRL